VFAGFVSTQEMASSIEDLSAPSAMGEESSAVVESRAAATIAVEEWLSAEPSPLPQGRVLSWNWAQEVPDLKEPERGSGGEIEPWDTIIAHDFTVVGKSTTFSVQVNTLVDPVGGVLVMGTPSLLPYAPAASGEEGGCSHDEDAPDRVNERVHTLPPALRASGQRGQCSGR